MRKSIALFTLLLTTSLTFAEAPPAADADSLLKQINETVPPPVDAAKRQDASYRQTYIAQYQATMAKRVDLAKKFAEKYPDRPESADQLLFVAQMSRDEKEQLKIYRQIATKYPTSDAAKEAAGPIRKLDAIGKPFDLSFTDAVSGKKIDLKELKGKVVLVDFWATWCGPCVASMPHNKELYAKYHDKGLEIVGISLDQPEAQGGLTKLKDFVSTNQIPWPQYYQGNGWASDFSKSWGINSIPTMFLIDPAGNLLSTEAESDLDTLIPQQLAKRSPT